jgi:hypothetical protein
MGVGKIVRQVIFPAKATKNYQNGGRGDGSESVDVFRDKGVICTHLSLVNPLYLNLPILKMGSTNTTFRKFSLIISAATNVSTVIDRPRAVPMACQLGQIMTADFHNIFGTKVTLSLNLQTFIEPRNPFRQPDGWVRQRILALFSNF